MALGTVRLHLSCASENEPAGVFHLLGEISPIRQKHFTSGSGAPLIGEEKHWKSKVAFGGACSARAAVAEDEEEE